jgi:hypothetical protein
MHFTFRSSDQFAKPAAIVKSILLAALLALFTFASAPLNTALAQSATTGAIGGTVADAGGALLPAATITVKSLDTGVTRTVKSNSSGEYRVPELEPGAYSASFTVDGFQTYQETGIVVTVGSLSTVAAVMKPGSVTNNITVTDETPLLHTESSDISTALDQAAIDNLPINGRRWSNFALLTPGVVSNSDGFGLLSFRGISFLLNNNTVDGADDNQAYFSEARGRTRVSYAITQAAIQEFQVNTSNYSAQYGRSAGGVINTVTKSGTNKLRGELFFYDRDLDLGGAVNPYTLLTVENNGVYNSVPYKPTDWRKQWGFGVGGPLKRDKLFWFYAYDQVRRNFPGTARAPDPNNTFAPSNAALPAGETCTSSQFTGTGAPTYTTEGDYNACAIAALFGVNFQAGSAYYQQGLNIVSSFLGTVPRVMDQVINLPKLEYQINERNRLSLMYNRMRESSPNGFQTQASNFYGRGSFGDDYVKEDFGIARLTSVLSSSIINDALVQYGRDLEYTMSDAPLPNEIPLSNNVFGKPAQITIGSYFSGSTGFRIGKSEDLDRAADPDERRLQLLDSATWSHGKHVSKAGLEFNRVVDYVNNLYDGNGNYSYDYSYDFISDYLHATTGLGGPNCSSTVTSACYTPLYYGYGQAFGNPIGEIATREYAGYATDDWRLRPNLTVTLGARYEYEYVPSNPFPNTGNPALAAVPSLTGDSTALPQTSNRPDDRNNIAPRIGFAWNLWGNNKTTLRGGYGMYFGRIINSNILQAYEDSGSPNAQIQMSSLYVASGHCGPTFPALEPSFAVAVNCNGQVNGASSGTATTVAYLDSHMQNPQVHEADLAIERDLGHKTVLALTYMMSLGRELPRAIDTNINLTNTAQVQFTVAASSSTTATSTNIALSTTTQVAPPQPAQTGNVTQPHGGATAPLTVGQTLDKITVFLASSGTKYARPNPAYGQILDVQSSVNSSYNALAVQINHPFEHGFSLMSNYTWSHSLDNNPYQSTVVPAFNVLDPTNLKGEHGNGIQDIRQRFVFAAVYQPQTHFHGLKDKVIGGWRIAPMVQMQTGLPYTPYISGSASGSFGTVAYKGLNGSGSSAARLPWIERNTYHRPKTAVVDVRLGKNFYFDAPHFDRMRFELFGEVFNLMNHQNITGINDQAYSLSGTTLTQTSGFGTYNNSNSNWTYSSRQIQIAARLHF